MEEYKKRRRLANSWPIQTKKNTREIIKNTAEIMFTYTKSLILTSYRYRNQTLASFLKTIEIFLTVHKINLDTPIWGLSIKAIKTVGFYRLWF